MKADEIKCGAYIRRKTGRSNLYEIEAVGPAGAEARNCIFDTDECIGDHGLVEFTRWQLCHDFVVVIPEPDHAALAA